MNKYVVATLTAVLIASPVAAFAQGGSQTGQGTQDRDRTQVQDPSTHTGDEDTTQLQTRDQDRTQLTTATSGTSVGIGEEVRSMVKEKLQIRLESTTTPASSTAQWKEMIQQREQELNQEASTTPSQDQNVIRNENRVRLAVHALLAAKDLLGGIGPQVSQIAQNINNSVQTSANAEVQIQERSFWTRLFFGGDTAAATALTRTTEQNQMQLRQLTQLLAQASTTAELQTQLQVQLQTLEQEQTRLQQLAKDELGRWGIFSWRF